MPGVSEIPHFLFEGKKNTLRSRIYPLPQHGRLSPRVSSAPPIPKPSPPKTLPSQPRPHHQPQPMGGRDRSAGKMTGDGDRAAAAAAAAAAQEAIRSGCKDAMLRALLRDYNGAYVIAGELARHHTSPAILNLVGFVQEAIASEGEDRFTDMKSRILQQLPAGHPDLVKFNEAWALARPRILADRETAVNAYRKAAELAPKCAVTLASLGRAMGSCGRTAEAYQIFSSALRIRSPDSPDLAHPWMSAREDSTKLVETGLQIFLQDCELKAYLRCVGLLELLEAGDTINAKRQSINLANDFPFSARARMIGPFIDRAALQRSPSTVAAAAYQRLIRDTVDIADEFDRSLTVALFRAELMLSAGRYSDAETECIRGLEIDHPDDPLSQDIPPGSASGDGRRHSARIDWVTEKLEQLQEQCKSKLEELKMARQLDTLALQDTKKSGKMAAQPTAGELSVPHQSRPQGNELL